MVQMPRGADAVPAGSFATGSFAVDSFFDTVGGGDTMVSARDAVVGALVDRLLGALLGAFAGPERAPDATVLEVGDVALAVEGLAPDVVLVADAAGAGADAVVAGHREPWYSIWLRSSTSLVPAESRASLIIAQPRGTSRCSNASRAAARPARARDGPGGCSRTNRCRCW